MGVHNPNYSQNGPRMTMKKVFQELWPSFFAESQELEGIKCTSVTVFPKVMVRRLTHNQIARLSSKGNLTMRRNSGLKKFKRVIVDSSDSSDSEDNNELPDEPAESTNNFSPTSTVIKHNVNNDLIDPDILEGVRSMQKSILVANELESYKLNNIINKIKKGKPPNETHNLTTEEFNSYFEMNPEKSSENSVPNPTTIGSKSGLKPGSSSPSKPLLSSSPSLRGRDKENIKTSKPMPLSAKGNKKGEVGDSGRSQATSKVLTSPPPVPKPLSSRISAARENSPKSKNEAKTGIKRKYDDGKTNQHPRMVSIPSEAMEEYAHLRDSQPAKRKEAHKPKPLIKTPESTTSLKCEPKVDESLYSKPISSIIDSNTGKLDKQLLAMESVDSVRTVSLTLNSIVRELKVHQAGLEEELDKEVKALKKKYETKIKDVIKTWKVFEEVDIGTYTQMSKMYEQVPFNEKLRDQIKDLLDPLDKEDEKVDEKSKSPNKDNLALASHQGFEAVTEKTKQLISGQTSRKADVPEEETQNSSKRIMGSNRTPVKVVPIKPKLQQTSLRMIPDASLSVFGHTSGTNKESSMMSSQASVKKEATLSRMNQTLPQTSNINPRMNPIVPQTGIGKNTNILRKGPGTQTAQGSLPHPQIGSVHQSPPPPYSSNPTWIPQKPLSDSSTTTITPSVSSPSGMQQHDQVTTSSPHQSLNTAATPRNAPQHLLKPPLFHQRQQQQQQLLLWGKNQQQEKELQTNVQRAKANIPLQSLSSPQQIANNIYRQQAMTLQQQTVKFVPQQHLPHTSMMQPQFSMTQQQQQQKISVPVSQAQQKHTSQFPLMLSAGGSQPASQQQLHFQQQGQHTLVHFPPSSPNFVNHHGVITPQAKVDEQGNVSLKNFPSTNALNATQQQPQSMENIGMFPIITSAVSLAHESMSNPHSAESLIDISSKSCFLCGEVAALLCCGQFVYCSIACKSMDGDRHKQECTANKS